MPYISESSIQEVKNRLDAIAVVSEYVKLENRGGRWWACCPFHQEKSASFTVNPDLKTYYCFGCHRGGAVLNFVMEMDKLTFPEAIELLAKRYGVELVYETTGSGNFSAIDEAKKKAKEGLFELYNRISGTFHHFLMEKAEAEPAKQYIISRGISIEMLKRFRLGYVPAGRNWLHRFLTQKGYSGEFLKVSGLFSSQYPESSLFSGRLMFPIADRQGRTVAFGGRYLPSGQPAPADGRREPPKYINSPELEIYKKGETLFAADLAWPEIRKTKTVYIAEGYLDVIALHQAGITNAVAPLGTAFTAEQAKLVRRWAEKAVFFFDSDEAGQAAAVKAIYACRSNDLNGAVVVPETGPEGAAGAKQAKDPADILQHLGPQALHKTAKCCILNDFDYLIARGRFLYYNKQASSVQGKARAVAFLFPYLALLDSEVARNTCIEAIADAFGLLPVAVSDDYRRYVSGQSGERSARIKEEAYSRQSGGRTGSPIRMNDELVLLISMAVNHAATQAEKLFPKFRTALEINEIEDQNAKEIFIALEECIRYGETGMDEFLARISSPELRGFIAERSASGEFSVSSQQQLMNDGIRRIKGKRLERRQEEIIIKLREDKNESRNSEADGPGVRELLAEKMRIDNELYLLKQGR